MSDKIDIQRRNFFGTAAMTLATAQFALAGASQAGLIKLTAAPDADLIRARSGGLPSIKPSANTGFASASLKQIDAGLLNVGYAEARPAEWASRPAAARLALRHLQLRRRRATARRLAAIA